MHEDTSRCNSVPQEPQVMNVRFLLVSVLLLLPFQLAQADIVVNFVESAPKDRFVIKNTGVCAYDDLVVEIDLSDSAGRLIFDTTSRGAGVEVFQPFEVRSGDLKLVSANEVRDGEKVLAIGIKSLLPETTVSFTIDVDDTLRDSELGNIRVSGSEIMNGLVNINYREQPVSSAQFDANSVAIVAGPEC